VQGILRGNASRLFAGGNIEKGPSRRMSPLRINPTSSGPESFSRLTRGYAGAGDPN
jgi:hypothetical protein